MAYAFIKDGIVENLIVSDANTVTHQFPNALLIDGVTPAPQIGWAYGIDGSFYAPGSPVPSTGMTQADFRARFTVSELIAIDNFPMNPTLSSITKEALGNIVGNFYAAPAISLSDPLLIQGVGYLVTCGILTSARATAILA